VRSGNISGAVVSNKVGDLDCTGSQTLLVSLIESFERYGSKVG
jgi:hypothetical protein